jgi:hypothetical protein
VVSLLDVAVLIVIGVLGYSGVDGGTPITVTCSSAYWLSKFADINLWLKVSFFHCIVSAVFSIVVVVLLVTLLLKLRRGETVRVRGAIIGFLYFSASITVYSAIVVAGYHFTFYREIENCSPATYNSVHLMAIGISAIILAGLAFILWIMLCCIYRKTTDPDEKYREVSNSQTEPS